MLNLNMLDSSCIIIMVHMGVHKGVHMVVHKGGGGGSRFCTDPVLSARRGFLHGMNSLELEFECLMQHSAEPTSAKKLDISKFYT
jgi:hypothetical protein